MRDIRSASTRRRACLLGACVSLTVLVACGEKKPKGEGPYAELVAEFVPKIEQETGLPFKTPPKIESRTRDEVGKFVRQQLESERARKELAGQESAYKLLGSIPDTMNLLALLQKLLEEQIVGYYDPATKVLYVVDGAAPADADAPVTIRVPGSKSISNRALLLAGLSKGTTLVKGLLASDDTQVMITDRKSVV